MYILQTFTTILKVAKISVADGNGKKKVTKYFRLTTQTANLSLSSDATRVGFKKEIL